MAAALDNLLSWRSLALHPLAVRARTVTGADGVAIALRAGNDIICEASVGVAPQVGSKVDRSSTWSARCLREAQPVSVSHSGENSEASYSAVLAPILHGGRAIGFCGAFSTRADAFTTRHVRMLTAIAQAAARAVAPAPRLVPPRTDLGRKRQPPVASPEVSAQPSVKTAQPVTTTHTRSAQPQTGAYPAHPAPPPPATRPVVSNPVATPPALAQPLAPPVAVQPPADKPQDVAVPPPAPVSSEVWTDVEAQIEAFAAHQKRRARVVLVGRSAVAALILAVLGACFYPDQISEWTQPVFAKIQNSFQHTSSPSNEPVDVSGKPSAAKSTADQK